MHTPLLIGLLGVALSGCGEEDASFPRLQREEDGTCSIPEDQIFSGGVGQDGIPALTDPALVEAGSAEASYLRDHDRVIGLELGDAYVAVPHNILWWHEIVNFNAVEPKLAVTYCPLTGSSIVFDRAAAGDVEFGVSGLLFQNNLMMYDRSACTTAPPSNRCGPR